MPILVIKMLNYHKNDFFECFFFKASRAQLETLNVWTGQRSNLPVLYYLGRLELELRYFRCILTYEFKNNFFKFFKVGKIF